MQIKERFNLARRNGEIGLEIEEEGQIVEMDLDYWKQEYDGSLRGNNMEYVLRAPVSRELVPDMLTYLKNKFKEYGIITRPSDRCGVHVHINCQYDEEEEVINFICLYYVFETILTKYCGEDREGNLFCLRARDADYILNRMRNCIGHNIAHIINYNVRYSSINFCSLAQYGSLEFRALRTPNDILDIIHWVNLLLKVKDYSKKFKEPSEIMEEFSRKGFQKFFKDVFKEQTNLLQYLGMEADAFEDLRRIQFFAYQFSSHHNLLKNKKVKRQKAPRKIRLHMDPAQPLRAEYIDFDGVPQDVLEDIFREANGEN